MAGPVLWRVEPIAGESLASLVTRTTRRNLLPSAHVLLRQVGVRHANNPTAALHPGVDERRLADILRLPLHEISRRRHKPRAEAGFVDFYGAAVRADEMVFRRRRFAPSAIATSPHSRDLWSFKTYHLKGLSSAVLPTPVRNALKEVLATISSSPGRVPPDQIGMREAALLTGQEERKLAAARRAGQLGTRICLRANRLLPTLDRREIETLNAFLHSRVGPEAASHRLGLPQYALHLIAREGLIRFADHPYVVAHYGPGQMDEAELVRFQDRLRDCATGIDLEDPVPLRKAARAIGGGAKPWGTIVRGLMTGGIPFGMGGDGIDDIVISGLDAARIRTFPTCGEGVMPLRCISQRDAVEILNLPLRHANLLGRSLKTGGSLRLPVADVLELARVRVTLAELCALTGIHGTRLEAMLEKDGCSRRDAMGWSRDVAIKRVARL